MKVVKINVSLDSYTGSGKNYFPIVLFGSSLLQSAYNDVPGVSFSGGSVGVTTKSIDAVDSFTTFPRVITVNGGALKSANLNIVTNNDVAVYKLRDEDTTPVNAEAGDTANVPNYDKHVATGDNEISEVSISGTVRVPNIIGSSYNARSMVHTLVTTAETVVTGVTGGGGSAFDPDIDYQFDGDTVGISGNGYKKKLTDTQTKPLKIKFIRFFIEGTDAAFTNKEVFNQESYLLKADGSKVDKSNFQLISFFSPQTVQSNIVDVPINTELTQDQAIIFGALKSATVGYSIAVYYED